MSVYVSSRHMYVQFIDDTVGRTLAHCSTLTKGIGTGKNNIETARNLGRIAAQAALEKGIRQVVFDRGGFTYGGRIKALADAAREAGLQF
jgi:large subunit ribosomal protein L18